MREFHGCRTVRDLIPRQARERPDAIALMHRDRATSYGELDERTKRIAHGLIAMGLRPQDRIAYLGKNSDLYFELLLGAAAANVVLAPDKLAVGRPEIASVLQDVEAKILFVGRGFSDVATALNVPGLDRVVSMGEGASGLVDFEKWRDAQPANDPNVEVDPKILPCNSTPPERQDFPKAWSCPTPTS